MIFDCVSQLAAEGSASSSSSELPHPDNSLAVLLQPGFPETVEAVNEALPDYDPHIIAGLRRRAWQEHLRRLGFPATSRPPPVGYDRALYLVQVNQSMSIPNWPPETPRPIPPPVLRDTFGLANRRRLRVRRPAPRLHAADPALPLQAARRRARRADRRRDLRAALPGPGAVPGAVPGGVPGGVPGQVRTTTLSPAVRRRVRRVALPGRPRLRERMVGDRRRIFPSGVIPGTIPPDSSSPRRRRVPVPHNARATRERSRSRDDAV